MATSDLDALIQGTRNPACGCPVTAALDKLPAGDRRKFHDAFTARGTDGRWAYVGTDLARVLAGVAGVPPIDGRAVQNYRRKHA